MTDPTRLEPRNGDFVAYVEALQEESLGFIGSACIMIGFFMTFAAMAEGREDLAGPFIFLMIVGGLIGRIAKSRR